LETKSTFINKKNPLKASLQSYHMKGNRSVLLFIIVSFTFYVVLSFVGYALHLKWEPFKKINLLSDLVKEKSIDVNDGDSAQTTPPPVIIIKPNYNFSLYKQAHLITNFNADSTKPALTNFLQKLYELKTGKKRKIRIAYFGDSMIEGDLLTKTLRALLQKEFGGDGVGFVPITALVAQFRQTVNSHNSDGWVRESFKTEGAGNQLFLSGYLFHSHGDWVQMKDETILDSTVLIEKSLLCGYEDKPVTIKINDADVVINPDKIFNRIVIGKDFNKSIKLFIADEKLPVYGISFESESGVLLDNFSFRGISGVEFNKIDSAFLSKIAIENPYDLIIFQYGVNVLFKPNDINFNWYARLLKPAVLKLKRSFSTADFLMVSTADRAFRYEDGYASAKGIDSLIKIQASVAYEVGANFYNQFQSMGGRNSIVDWANQTPALANRDYVHPNSNGAAILGKYFFDALMKDYKKYAKSVLLKTSK